ncbi:MAG: outer membrane beta-barrel domain-containing protein [Proteobacteria bacterium]|nr:outer membrane beta-barrel domain-containing protein [Pseudomonadota bacterium]MCP4916871.1 outer membrane beta-barrel domain-containing protein [Pseudomonadota bacterium]
MISNAIGALFLVGGLALSGTALADEPVDDLVLDGIVQDDDDDDLDDILGGDTEESVKDEREALKSGDIDDRVGVQSEQILEEQIKANRRVIKTLQRKNFLKLGRFEAGVLPSFVTNDPFLNRYIISLRGGYHITEIFAIEVEAAISPDLGEADWKPLTKQLVNENHVSPDISKLLFASNATFQFSPIYGKVALRGNNIINFDIYGAFGMGVVRTKDDLKALQAEGDPIAEQTKIQTHPTTNFGGGVRIVFNEFVAVRVDGRSLVYIETVNSTTLEMKNNFVLGAGVTFFFPGMQ